MRRQAPHAWLLWLWLAAELAGSCAGSSFLTAFACTGSLGNVTGACAAFAAAAAACLGGGGSLGGVTGATAPEAQGAAGGLDSWLTAEGAACGPAPEYWLTAEGAACGPAPGSWLTAEGAACGPAPESWLTAEGSFEGPTGSAILGTCGIAFVSTVTFAGAALVFAARAGGGGGGGTVTCGIFFRSCRPVLLHQPCGIPDVLGAHAVLLHLFLVVHLYFARVAFETVLRKNLRTIISLAGSRSPGFVLADSRRLGLGSGSPHRNLLVCQPDWQPKLGLLKPRHQCCCLQLPHQQQHPLGLPG